jgi:uncharacterized protein YbjT (DUF2867 family)
LVHTPAKASALAAAEVELVPGDFEDPASLDRAVADVEQVFLLSPPHLRQAELQGNLVQAAHRAGARRLVKLSALGASPDWPLPVPRWHWQTEQAGFAFAHLRPNYFMQMAVAGRRISRIRTRLKTICKGRWTRLGLVLASHGGANDGDAH